MKHLAYISIFTLLLFSCGKSSNQLNKEAEAFEAKGEFHNSIPLLEEAIKKDPNNKHALINLGVDYSLIGEYQKAIETYDQLIKIDPKNGLAFLNRGKNKARLNKQLEAIDDYNSAINTQGNEMFQIRTNNNIMDLGAEFEVDLEEVLLQRGIAYFKTDSLQLSFKDLNYCILKNYSLDIAHLWRGYIYINYQDTINSCKDFHKALSLGDTTLKFEIKKFCQ